MSRQIQVSSKQCKRARSLLHWNIQDISSRCNITRVRLEQFERGDVPLTRIESDLLLKVFTKNGVIINAHGDVLLREDAKKDETEAAAEETHVYGVNAQTYASEQLQNKTEESEEERKRRLEAEKNPLLRK